MRRLETYGDGWRLAADVLRQLQIEGPEKCRANLPPYYSFQADALIMALVELKERGTVEACCGFGQIVTDLAGTRSELDASFYERMAREGRIRPYKLKRLVNAGHRLAVLALRRENEDGPRMPAKAEPGA